MEAETNLSRVNKPLISPEPEKPAFVTFFPKGLLFLITVLFTYALTYIFYLSQYIVYKIPLSFLEFGNQKVIGYALLLSIITVPIMFAVVERWGIKISMQTKKLEKLYRPAIVGVALIVLILSIVLGITIAQNKTEYYVINVSKQNFVVLDSTKNHLIIAPVSLKKKEIARQYQIIDTRSDIFDKEKQISLKLTTTGALKVQK